MDAQASDRSFPATRSRPRPARSPGSAGPGHAAAIVGSEAELLAVALPFLDAGLRAGDLVALACSTETVELLSRELGERATSLVSDPGISLLGSRAPDALILSRRYLERAMGTGSGQLCTLSEIDFGPSPAGWREGQRFESVYNRLMGQSPVSAVCLYDRRRLPESVIDSAAPTHPQLIRGTVRSASPRFQDPGTYVPSLPLPREPVEDGEPVFSVADAPTLVGLRHQLGAVLTARVRDRDQREDLHLGASEIAANAFRHGVRPVSARVWADGDRLICVITDRGTAYDDPLSGFAPAHGSDLSHGGMGLWLARKLWDHVDLLPGPDGLTVRLSSRLR
ncbi:MAG: putative anti-sigma regulatory factor, serine/threonine protein kinase [Blastococcus sp.]|nr:putative anti-sigma regulatory factor, serine/threonine protein kinase [Blastococcus sp.]